MAAFFPRHSIAWHLAEPSLLRRVSLSLPIMAALTGVIVRLYRLAVLASAETPSWALALGTVALGTLIVLALTTMHLANYPLRPWLWRAPVFGVVAGATEAAGSAALIALGVERMGTQVAHWRDWATLAQKALVRDVVGVVVFALLLAAVVQVMRLVLLKREHRTSTAQAVHRASEREQR